MAQRSNKDVYVLLAVIATIVVLAVAITWSRPDQPETPLDTETHTTPGSSATP